MTTIEKRISDLEKQRPGGLKPLILEVTGISPEEAEAMNREGKRRRNPLMIHIEATDDEQH